MIDFADALRESNAFRIIRHDVDNGSLSHAYMVISPDAYALRQFLTLACCKIYCRQDACLECSACGRIMDRNHADVRYVNELDKTIKVDDIAALIEDSFMTPYESDRKIYVVYSAEKMNAASQNKLLKTLEEPRPSVTIFLAVGNESAMLDTVRSRSKVIYLDRFSADTIKAEMLKHGCSGETADLAAACSDGLLGRALQIVNSTGYADLYDRALEILTDMRTSADMPAFLGDRALSKENMPAFLDMLSVIMRDMLVCKTDPELVMGRRQRERIAVLAEEYSPAALSNILYLINEERKKLTVNVNSAGLAENLFFGILEEKYKCRSR